MRRAATLRSLVLAVVLLSILTIPTVASSSGNASNGSSKGLARVSTASASPIGMSPIHSPFSVNGSVGYLAVGVGLRNEPNGLISIKKIPAGAGVVAAYLIYSIQGDLSGPYGSVSPTITVQRTNGPSMVFRSHLIGNDSDLCWGSAGDFAYWADVTPIVTGNAKYIVTGFPSGQTNRTDPWAHGAGTQGSPLPQAEGASLVVVYTVFSPVHTKVSIWVGDTSILGLSSTQTLSFPKDVSGGGTTTFIVSDGQNGTLGGGGGKAVINSITLAGPGSAIRPGDAFPGLDLRSPTGSQGNLWDTLTLKPGTSVISAGSTSASFSVVSGSDCIGWIGQVFASH